MLYNYIENINFIKIDSTYFEQLKKLQLSYKASIGEDTPTDKDFTSLCTAISDGRIYFYGCVHDGELIACCSVCPTYSTFNYAMSGVFEDFYIDPEYRHKGLARKLVKYAYDESNIESLTVGAADCDVEMYRSLGFSVPIGNMLSYS